ncbi:MAG TPA: response regulator [Bryobacteraceae bacterium]|nr:response regulator [Bryobacteraceae bacterium]
MPIAGTETVLVVDDESAVLNMTRAMLTRYGYGVISATAGRDALTAVRSRPHLKIHIALIDVVMQDMAGPELARELWQIVPGLPVLFMTGFPDQHQLLKASGMHVLYKPFTSIRLIRRVREILDRPRAAAAPE